MSMLRTVLTQSGQTKEFNRINNARKQIETQITNVFIKANKLFAKANKLVEDSNKLTGQLLSTQEHILAHQITETLEQARAKAKIAFPKEERFKSKSRAKNNRADKKNLAFTILGNKCNWYNCHWTDVRALQIDHKDGGGTKELRKRGAIYIYNKICKMENPHEEYQLLCANHNWIKRVENHEYGREKNWKEEFQQKHTKPAVVS